MEKGFVARSLRRQQQRQGALIKKKKTHEQDWKPGHPDGVLWQPRSQ